MKLTTLIIGLLALSACDRALDKQTRDSLRNVSQNSNVVIAPLEITFNNETESELVDFGEYRSNTVKVKRVQLSNKTMNSIEINNLKSLIEAWDNSSSNPNSVSVSGDSCSSKSLAAGKSCSLDISVRFNEELAGSAEIIPVRGSDSATSPTLQLMMSLDTEYLTPSQSIVKSTSSLNFGYMVPGASANRRVYISNTNPSQSQAAPIIASSLPTGVSVARNTCESSMKPRSSCFIDFNYQNQAADLSGEVLLSSPGLSSQDSSVSLSSIAIQDTLPANAPKVSLTYRDFSTNSSIGSNYIRRFIFSNNSSLENFNFSASELAADFSHPSFTVLKNNCDGRSIRPGKFCIIDIKHTPTINGQYVVFSVDVPSANFTQEVKVGNQLQSCPNNSYIIVNDACVIANQSRQCVSQPDNSSGGIESSTDGAQTWGACTGFSCSSNYEIAGAACSPISCTPQNAGIANAASVSGDKVGGCSLESCLTDYTKISQNCVISAQSRACQPANQPANSSGGEEFSTDGGQTYGQCTGFTCADKYDVGVNSCTPTICTVANSGINNAATVSGNRVAGCQLLTCLSSYTAIGNLCVSSNQSRICSSQPVGSTGGEEFSTDGGQTYGQCTGFTCTSQLKEPQGISCVDKTPTGSIAFTETHTNQTSATLTINYSNALQFERYSDSSCNTILSAAVSVTPSMSIPLAAGEGVRVVYAKLVNGTAKSDCLSASIIKEETSTGTSNSKISWTNIPNPTLFLNVNNDNHQFGLENTSFYQQSLLSDDFNIGALSTFPAGFGFDNPCSTIDGGEMCEIDVFFDAEMFHYNVEFIKQVYINGQQRNISLTGHSPCSLSHPNPFPSAGPGKRLNQDKTDCVINQGVYDDPNSVFGHAVFQ